MIALIASTLVTDRYFKYSQLNLCLSQAWYLNLWQYLPWEGVAEITYYPFLQTTNSDRFVVCPPYGIVEPKSTRFVRVYLKAPSRYEDSLKFCQDRFLVQSIAVDDQFDERDINSDLFRSRDRQEAKLKVVVVRFPSMKYSDSIPIC